MTRFHFTISGWHELDEAYAEKYATFSDEQKAEYAEKVRAHLRNMMISEAIDDEAPFELAIKYDEAVSE